MVHQIHNIKKVINSELVHVVAMVWPVLERKCETKIDAREKMKLNSNTKNQSWVVFVAKEDKEQVVMCKITRRGIRWNGETKMAPVRPLWKVERRLTFFKFFFF
jgi:hypothetical protein